MSAQPPQKPSDTAPHTVGASDTDDRFRAVLARVAAVTGAAVVEAFDRAVAAAERKRPAQPAPIAPAVGRDRLEDRRGGAPQPLGALLDGDRGKPAARADGRGSRAGAAAPATAVAEKPAASTGGRSQVAEEPNAPTTESASANRRKRRAQGAHGRRDRERREALRRRWHPTPEQVASAAPSPPENRAQNTRAKDAKMPPRLRLEARWTSLQIAQDGTGRRCREALVHLLPYRQAALIVAAWLVVAPHLARVWTLSRSWISARTEALDLHVLGSAIARDAIERVAASEWGRRLVQCAVVLWAHRRRDGAAGYRIEGFAQKALGWLVPRADGRAWSRSALWRSAGPMLLLAGVPRRPGREPERESGLGLFGRWQPAAHRAAFVGPIRVITAADGSTRTEQWGVAEMRYSPSSAGHTALELAERGNQVARAYVELLTPWLASWRLQSANVPESPEKPKLVSGAEDPVNDPARPPVTAPLAAAAQAGPTPARPPPE